MARSIGVLSSVMASVWNDNLLQEATEEGSSYWNPPLTHVLAHSQEPTDGLQVPGRTFFGQVQPGEESTRLRDDDNQRRYATFPLFLATELDGGIRESIFRLPNMTREEWIHMQEKAFPLPFYATFELMAAPPLGRRCPRCGREHGPGGWCILGREGDPNGFKPCQSPFAPPGRRTRSRSAGCSTIGARGASTEGTKRTANVNG
jgi:hypothetical protein